MFWWRNAGLLISLFLLSLLFYPLGGLLAVLAVMGSGLLGWLVYQLYQLRRLKHWLLAPDMHNVPQTGGAWAAIYERLYRQLRAQHKSQQRLSHTLDRFVAAGEAMPEGVVVLDSGDRIEWCNPRAMQHLGLNRQTDIGQHLAYLVRQPAFQNYLAAQDYSQPVLVRTANELVLSVQCVPFDVSRKLLLSRDITQLERVQTVHRDFVANVSHELRTPLTVISGFVETLLDIPDLDVATRNAQLKLMHDQAGRMQRLVEDLLTLSRLENGIEMREDSVDAPALMRMLENEAHGLSQGRHQISLDLHCEQGLMGNFDELHSAFGNLVSNAVRYTPDGGAIKISWVSQAGKGVFSVADSGIGVEAQHIPRLTERFYRVDRGRSRSSGGTGLGLAIVKHIAQRHQAKLEISSELGKGSRFCIQFPVHRLIKHKQSTVA